MKFSNLLKLLFLSLPIYAREKRLASIFNECTKPGVVALTLDDGPHSKFTPIVLDLLKANNIKATFFLNGMNYGSDIENSDVTKSIIKRQVAEGHDVGSHTFYHKNCFSAYEDGSLKENIERLQKGIENIIHRTPRFFRPPLGEGGFSQEYCEKIHVTYDPRTEIVRGILAGDGYRYGPDYGDYDYDIILWSADPEDWKCDGTSVTVKDAIASLDLSMSPEIADPSKNSFIILVHDVTEYSVTTTIPEIINHVRSLGYTFVPLSECIGREPYRELTSSTTTTSSSSSEGETKAAEKDDTNVSVSGAEPMVEEQDTTGVQNTEAVAAAPDAATTQNNSDEVDDTLEQNSIVAQDVTPVQNNPMTMTNSTTSQDNPISQKNNDMIINNGDRDAPDADSSSGKLSIITFSGIIMYGVITTFLIYF